MSDRSLSRDMADHVARAAGQPQPDLRALIAAEFQRLDAHEWGYDHGFSADVDNDPETASFVDAALAVVQADVDRARATNRRLNLRCQEQESRLAAYARLVAEWQLGEKGTYVPLRTLTAIAKLAGREVDEDRYELHYQRVDATEADLVSLRADARTAAALLRDTAERVEQQRTVNAVALRAAATALDEITGGQP